jgi:hypothetical protein
MLDSFQRRVAAVNAATLTPLVRAALQNEALQLEQWQVVPLKAGGGQRAGGVLGLFRFSGEAQDPHQAEKLSWSLILKAFGGASTGSDDASSWNYWQREPLVYQSQLLEQLPGGLAAPRCYRVETYAEEEFWVWLEDIQEAAGAWTLEQYGLTARHLGQFNGAYLAGYPLPVAYPWLTWGRTQAWCKLGQPIVERCAPYATTPIGKRLFVGDAFERTLHLWSGHQQLLNGFVKLPTCFCHHDAFRRNLFTPTTGTKTVAIDWALTGLGRVGEEIGVTTAVSLTFTEVAAHQARDLDRAVFTGYVEGLWDAGWRGDRRQARLGCTVNAFLLVGTVWRLAWLERLQQPEVWQADLEAFIGRPLDEVIDQWAEMQLFLLDLGEEAYQLLNELT